MHRTVLSFVSVAALLSSGVASAVTITFGGVNPNDGSQLTSAYTPNNANDFSKGLFVETFDAAPGSTDNADGCALNSAAFGVTISGNYGLFKGNHPGLAAPPGQESTCFASGPLQLNKPNTPNSATIDFGTALNTSFSGKKIDYLGFYWGSIDDYNSITFYSGDQVIQTLNGADVRAAGAASGNQIAVGSNRYVNLAFDADEQFTKLVFSSNNYAFEIDNVAIRVAGVNQVPEPASLGLLGFGLVASGFMVRRRKNS